MDVGRFTRRFTAGNGVLIENGPHGHPGYSVARHNRAWLLPEIEDGSRDGAIRECVGCYCTDGTTCCFCDDRLWH